ncbi:MAG: hypothetical protein HUU38_00325 [Anaerolineales bacterium]|nr:hypothetical protein [Anaerolineales bacterium]
MIQNVEEEYMDILQNMEMAIHSVYRQNQTLADANVDNALEALERTYMGELRGRAAVIPQNPVTRMVYEQVQTMCEWRLGRASLENEEGTSSPEIPPVSHEVILACLKRLRKSLRLWTKEGGPQGYLNYIEQFLP